MNAARSKVVFDCMIFVQMQINPQGPSAACFGLCESLPLRLVATRKILGEVRSVLDRAELRRRYPHITDSSVHYYLNLVCEIAEIAADPLERYRYPRDPKDEPYLNLAIAENADFLVSRDNDLLDLMNPENPDGIRLRQEAPNLKIVDPIEFLRNHSS